MRHRPLVALAALLFLPALGVADGYKMHEGRYASGPVTVLALNSEQALTARTARLVVLTPEQQQRLQRDARIAPTVLYLHSLAVTGKDCTCGEYDYAIWFQPD